VRKRREGIAETAREAATVENEIPGTAITKSLFGRKNDSEGLTGMSPRGRLLNHITTGS
jgi:hypothetical protein